jgi:hypothetical protein
MTWFEPSKKERLTIGQVLKEELEKAPLITTSSYTPVAADANRLIEVDAATGKVVTIHPNVFTTGQQLRILQAGAGVVTVAAGAGMTIESRATQKTDGQWAVLTVLFRSPTSAVVTGAIAASA